jgi:hypothetical protein
MGRNYCFASSRGMASIRREGQQRFSLNIWFFVRASFWRFIVRRRFKGAVAVVIHPSDAIREEGRQLYHEIFKLFTHQRDMRPTCDRLPLTRVESGLGIGIRNGLFFNISVLYSPKSTNCTIRGFVNTANQLHVRASVRQRYGFERRWKDGEEVFEPGSTASAIFNKVSDLLRTDPQ